MLEVLPKESRVITHAYAASAAVLAQLAQLLGLQSRCKAWIGKASVAILDQGVMTGSNFVVGVLLARWLVPTQYGAYAIAYAFFLLLSLFFQALVLEPMSVFGPSHYRERLPEYFGVLLRAYIGLSLVPFLVLAIGSWVEHAVAHAPALSWALIGAAVATPCLLLLWLARSGFYVMLSPNGAVVGGISYSAILLAGVLVLQHRSQLSPWTVFLLMAAAGLGTGAVQFTRLKPVYNADPAMSLGGICHEHWQYGRWILASSFVVWIPSNIYYAVFSSHSMMSLAGELRALLNLTLPVGQTATALSLLVQPYAARRHSYFGSEAVVALVRRTTVLYAAGAAFYWVFLSVFSTHVLHHLYAGKYTGLGHLVPWVGLSSIFAVAAHGPGIGLRAIRSPASVFAAFLAPSAISVAIGIPATLTFGVPGAVATLVVANTVAMALALLLFYRRVHAFPEVEPKVVADQPLA
jgi:O-antigen/teichoic acid export membrane protein